MQILFNLLPKFFCSVLYIDFVQNGFGFKLLSRQQAWCERLFWFKFVAKAKHGSLEFFYGKTWYITFRISFKMSFIQMLCNLFSYLSSWKVQNLFYIKKEVFFQNAKNLDLKYFSIWNMYIFDVQL